MRGVFALALALAAGGRAALAVEAPVSPAAGWATAYLVNAIFVTEYDAVATTLAKEGRAKELVTDPSGRLLWRRAAFALAAMEAKSQGLSERDRIKTLINAQAATFKESGVDLTPQTQTLAEAAASDGAAEAAPGFQLIGESFASEAMRGHWQKLSRSFGMASPTCPIELADVQAFAAHQRQLLAGDHGANPNLLLKPLNSWTLPKVQCLVFALMASAPEAKAKDGYEPLHLLRALGQTASPMARDLSLRALLAVRYLELARYSETLSLLMDLSDMDDSFRLPYEMVQRVFSIRQKGEGAVALQGI